MVIPIINLTNVIRMLLAYKIVNELGIADSNNVTVDVAYV